MSFPSGRGWRELEIGAFLIALVLLSANLSAQSNGGQSQQPSQQQQDQGIPDAPSAVQPPQPPQALPKPDNQVSLPPPVPANSQKTPGNSAATGSEKQPPPSMPPVETVPQGTQVPKGPNSSVQQELYKLKVSTNFVEVPVTVKSSDGRLVYGLVHNDFSVYENGKPQKLTFFTSDPFELSAAVLIDIGMQDSEVQKVNQTYPALVGAFSPYDEVAVYTYSTTVSQLTTFGPPSNRLSADLHQMETVRGRNNGPAVLSGPLAPNGPIVNGIPVGSPSPPVYTPPREGHVLNDAVLRAALDLSKRAPTRRKIIFVISDGRELGSTASYRDVLRVLLANGIQVKAITVGGSALPVYRKIEKFHIPFQGYSNILPKYVSASGGGQVFPELTANAISDAYAQVTSEARNQYTLGYTTKPTVSSVCRNIVVNVDRPNLKVYAKDGYCPGPSPRP